MLQLKQPCLNAADVWRTMRVCRWQWLAPALTICLAATTYALMRPERWEATQTLLVRNEAAGNLEGPGKFLHAEEMKAAQETIGAIATSQGLLAEVLTAAGRPVGYEGGEWPAPADVTEFSRSVTLSPPKGAEFGTTEILHLTVRDRDRQRALKLVACLYDELESRVRQLRDSKAQSVLNELNKAVSLAEADLQAATMRLAEIERSAGGDLAQLRALDGSATSDSHLGRKILELECELRQARVTQRQQEELLTLLRSSQVDPGRLLATPRGLLESQPALGRLKDGLVDAQLRTAQLLGGMSVEHPLVRAARDAEQQVGQNLHDELAVAIRGVEVELRLSAQRADSLEEQLSVCRTRLNELAGQRAEYSNLLAQVQARGKLLAETRHQQAAARGSQAASQTASLISRIDGPRTPSTPSGPSRAMIVLAGVVGGVVVGVGVLFLALQPLPAVVVERRQNGYQIRYPERRRLAASTGENALSLQEETVAATAGHGWGAR